MSDGDDQRVMEGTYLFLVWFKLLPRSVELGLGDLILGTVLLGEQVPVSKHKKVRA